MRRGRRSSPRLLRERRLTTRRNPPKIRKFAGMDIARAMATASRRDPTRSVGRPIDLLESPSLMPFQRRPGGGLRPKTAASFFLGLLAVGSVSSQVAAEQGTHPFAANAFSAETRPSMAADFRGEPASNEARQVADWALDTRDNRGSPFVIVDKKNAKVFVFAGKGRLLGATQALLGSALGGRLRSRHRGPEIVGHPAGGTHHAGGTLRGCPGTGSEQAGRSLGGLQRRPGPASRAGAQFQ